MKLPRLGNPQTKIITESNIFGDETVIEITTASQFDLLPTWAQWAMGAASVLIFLSAVAGLFIWRSP